MNPLHKEEVEVLKFHHNLAYKAFETMIQCLFLAPVVFAQKNWQRSYEVDLHQNLL